MAACSLWLLTVFRLRFKGELPVRWGAWPSACVACRVCEVGCIFLRILSMSWSLLTQTFLISNSGITSGVLLCDFFFHAFYGWKLVIMCGSVAHESSVNPEVIMNGCQYTWSYLRSWVKKMFRQVVYRVVCIMVLDFTGKLKLALRKRMFVLSTCEHVLGGIWETNPVLPTNVHCVFVEFNNNPFKGKCRFAWDKVASHLRTRLRILLKFLV